MYLFAGLQPAKENGLSTPPNAEASNRKILIARIKAAKVTEL
jgi:hypothetical protein